MTERAGCKIRINLFFEHLLKVDDLIYEKRRKMGGHKESNHPFTTASGLSLATFFEMPAP